MNKKRKTKPSPEPKPKLSDNRKSGQATRTLKACDTCRKQKVRCIKYDNSMKCVRCSFLNKSCSFEIAGFKPNDGLNPTNMTPTTSSHMSNNTGGDIETNTKLLLIYSGVQELLLLMKTGKGNASNDLLNNDARLLLEAASSMKKSSTPTTPSFHFNDAKQLGFPSPQNLPPSLLSHQDGVAVYDQDDDEDDENEDDVPQSFQAPSNSLMAAPFSIIQNQTNYADIPQPILNLLNLSTVQAQNANNRNKFYDYVDDVISLGILNELETIDLINDFRRNYGRWVLFPLSIPTGVLIERIRYKSSLLLTTCCCLSLRYLLNGDMSPGDIDNFRRKKRTYNLVMKQLVKDLDRSLLKYTSFQGSHQNSGDIEFLQALVILSIYSLSLSSVVSNTIDKTKELVDEDFELQGLNLDPWFLSGMGLTTFITKSTFGTFFRNMDLQKKERSSSSSSSILGDNRLSPFTILYDELDTDEYQTLTILRIYNHLTLVHLINCIFSGRMCVVDEIRLNFCTNTLSLPSSTNFDGRMVSEIGILLIAYNYVQVNSNGGVIRTLKECESSLQAAEDEIKSWYEQWEYLFSQPALQFVELCYDFCNVVIYFNFNYKKSVISGGKNNIGPRDPKVHGAEATAASPGVLDVYDVDNVEFIIKYCDEMSLIKMLQYSYHLIRFVNLIENDSYFAYLSDQIHVCFYFSAIVLMKILRYLKDNYLLHILDEVNKCDQSLQIGKHNWLEIIKSLQILMEKFGRIGGSNEDDIITNYKNGLNHILTSLFSPEELLRI